MALAGTGISYAQLPSLSVSRMLNEYTPAGETMVILGSNFDVHKFTSTNGKVLFGDTEGKIIRGTKDSLYVIVPASARPGVTVKVISGAKIEKTVPYLYQDNRNIIFDFESGSTSPFSTKSATPGPISGKYVRVKQEIESWAVIDFVQGNVALPAEAVKDPDAYVLKFEVNTLKPFNANMIKLMIDGDYHQVNTFFWKTHQTFDTNGKWVTHSVDLNKIVNTPLKESLSKHKIKFSFHGNGLLDADMAFDNFRIVPKED